MATLDEPPEPPRPPGAAAVPAPRPPPPPPPPRDADRLPVTAESLGFSALALWHSSRTITPSKSASCVGDFGAFVVAVAVAVVVVVVVAVSEEEEETAAFEASVASPPAAHATTWSMRAGFLFLPLPLGPPASVVYVVKRIPSMSSAASLARLRSRPPREVLTLLASFSSS